MTYTLSHLTDADRNNYPKAVQTELKNIKKALLPLIIGSWLQETIDKGDIRLKDYELPFGEVELDFGQMYKGKSPNDAWKNGKEAETYKFISFLQFLRLIQTNPEILKENNYLDFVVDELRLDRDWSYRPDFGRSTGSGAWVGGGRAGGAYGGFGSFGCAWESRDLKLDTLKMVEPLAFNSKIERTEMNIDGEIYVKKSETLIHDDVRSELVNIRKEHLGVANRITAYLKTHK